MRFQLIQHLACAKFGNGLQNWTLANLRSLTTHKFDGMLRLMSALFIQAHKIHDGRFFKRPNSNRLIPYKRDIDAWIEHIRLYITDTWTYALSTIDEYEKNTRFQTWWFQWRCNLTFHALYIPIQHIYQKMVSDIVQMPFFQYFRGLEGFDPLIFEELRHKLEDILRPLPDNGVLSQNQIRDVVKNVLEPLQQALNEWEKTEFQIFSQAIYMHCSICATLPRTTAYQLLVFLRRLLARFLSAFDEKVHKEMLLRHFDNFVIIMQENIKNTKIGDMLQEVLLSDD